MCVCVALKPGRVALARGRPRRPHQNHRREGKTPYPPAGRHFGGAAGGPAEAVPHPATEHSLKIEPGPAPTGRGTPDKRKPQRPRTCTHKQIRGICSSGTRGGLEAPCAPLTDRRDIGENAQGREAGRVMGKRPSKKPTLARSIYYNTRSAKPFSKICHSSEAAVLSHVPPAMPTNPSSHRKCG